MNPFENYVKEIVDLWTVAINEDRKLSNEETDYILKLQERAIEDGRKEDGLTEEEQLYEDIAEREAKIKNMLSEMSPEEKAKIYQDGKDWLRRLREE
jgi:hypothetical protein